MCLTKNKQYGPLTSYLSPRVLPTHFAGTCSLPSSLFIHKHVSDILNLCNKMPEMINSGGGKVCAGWCFGGFRPYSVEAITIRPSVRWEHRERLQLVGIRKQRKGKKGTVVSLPLKAQPPPKKTLTSSFYYSTSFKFHYLPVVHRMEVTPLAGGCKWTQQIQMTVGRDVAQEGVNQMLWSKQRQNTS